MMTHFPVAMTPCRRCARCLCVVCCQQEAFADAAKVLSSRKLRAYKAVVVASLIAGGGLAAWGMRSFDAHFPAKVSAQFDELQAVPIAVLGQVRRLGARTSNLTVPLDQLDSLLASANLTGMQTDLGGVSSFFATAPAPGVLRSTANDATAALSGSLANALKTLEALLVPGGPLESARQNVILLHELDISHMAAVLATYDSAIAATVAE